MPAAPIITVVMAVKDCVSFVREAIESILNQTWTNLELLVVVETTEDETWEVVSQIAADDLRLRVIAQSKSGFVNALNEGCAAARGQYIARLDADDVAVNNRLELQVEYLRNNPEVAVLGANAEYIGASGIPLGASNYGSHPEGLTDSLLKGNCIIHSTVIMQKVPFLQLGGYRSHFYGAEDYDLWLRMSEHHVVDNISAVVCKYRCHPKQSSLLALPQQLFFAEAAVRAAQIRRNQGDEANWIRQVSDAGMTLGPETVSTALRETILENYLDWINAFWAMGQPTSAKRALELAFAYLNPPSIETDRLRRLGIDLHRLSVTLNP